MLGAGGIDPAQAGDAAGSARHDAGHVASLLHDAAPAGQRLCNKGDIRAAFVGTRATARALTAIVAAGPALPRRRQDGQGVWRPGHAQFGARATDVLTGITESMGCERVRSTARALGIIRCACYTDQVFGHRIKRFQFGVADRPIGTNAEAAGHTHGRGMQAVRLAGKMQCAATHAAHMVVLLCQAAGSGHRAEVMVPGSQAGPLRAEGLHGRKRVGQGIFLPIRKNMLLPVRQVQTVVALRLVPGAGFQHQHAHAPAGQRPGAGSAPGAGPNDDHIGVHQAVFGAAA